MIKNSSGSDSFMMNSNAENLDENIPQSSINTEPKN